MFLYQTPAISGSVAICAVQWRRISLVASPLLLLSNQPCLSLSSSLSQRCRQTAPAASPKREEHNQGRLSDNIPQRITAQKKPIRVCCGEDTPSLQGPAQSDSHEHHLLTRWHCVRPFLYVWGFSNLVENACLSSVDSWVSEPLRWDACLPCTVLCCFLHGVKLM